MHLGDKKKEILWLRLSFSPLFLLVFCGLLPRFFYLFVTCVKDTQGCLGDPCSVCSLGEEVLEVVFLGKGGDYLGLVVP